MLTDVVSVTTVKYHTGHFWCRWGWWTPGHTEEAISAAQAENGCSLD